jgi:hypothetical protein
MTNDERHMIFALVLLILVCLVLTLSGIVHVFEDGSFAIGPSFPYWITGCIPWEVCGV